MGLLFIDTLHCYGQVKRELARHHSKVRQYIVLHDTEIYSSNSDCIEHTAYLTRLGWHKGEISSGIVGAIHDFLQENPDWTELVRFSHNSGLMVLKRAQQHEWPTSVKSTILATML